MTRLYWPGLTSLLGLRRCLLARNVQQVLDRAHSLDLARLGAEILDQVGLLELAAQVADAVLDVDVDLPLRDVGAAKDLALALASQRHVIGLRLFLLLQVRRLLLQALGLRGDGLPLPAALTERFGASLERFLTALAAVVGIEEVRECSSNGSCKSESRHQSVSLRRGWVRAPGLPGGGQAKLSTERSEGTSQIRGKSTDFLRELVAPVEVARASPEAVVTFDSSGLRLLVVFFAGPFEGDRRLRRDGRLGAVHRVLDAGLLLGLEQRVIVERILVLVAVERQLLVELRVPLLQLEMILDDLREKRRRIYGHCPPPGDLGPFPRTTADSSVIG